MRSPVHSRASSPKRRALHERTQSQTNERPPFSSVRLVNSKEDADVYASSPYPTKPEHVLLPKPGKGQGYDDAGFGVSDAPRNLSSATGRVEKSLPDPVAPGKLHDETAEVVRPPITPTIKHVAQESSSSSASSQLLPPPPSIADALSSSSSSPNVIPIGPPSSPNLVPLNTSSPNIVPIGSSSPNFVRERSGSSISSLNSLGTVIRTYLGATQWDGVAFSEGSNSQPQSLRSSPPVRGPGSPRSTSPFALPSADSNGSRPATASSHRTPSISEIQAFVDSGIAIQYPTIRAPSASSWADSASSVPVPSPLRLMSDRSSARWNPNLSTIQSDWTEEHQLSLATPSLGSSLPEPARPAPARVSNKSSSIRPVHDAEGDEHPDYLTNLATSQHRRTNSAFHSSNSSGSRENSLQSVRRTGSGSSLVINTIPVWARVYYSNDGQTLQNYALMVDSRPSSARPATSNSHVVSRVPTAISRPRTRARGNTTGSQQREIASDPKDPRSHWVRGPQLEEVPTQVSVPRSQRHNSWSPHLHLDKRLDCRGPMWQAPSMDSTAEPFFSRRNAQVYSFCLGFIVPLAWIIAAFLPLPERPVFSQDSRGADVERGFQDKVSEFEERRYENARWWRNVNRCMVPLGVGIMIVIIVLAVVGTTAGL
ncbi:hypothetical protein VTN00DRAFT_8686 [Thermoascus crustaceus]|uniref:uncharacterized protein n=1 Tax=Thermoascus crustaceus TaxID=5088 RepID=UPI0037426B4D